MKIIHENYGVKNYMKEDYRSYRRNFWSCENKAWKKKKNRACTGFGPFTSAIPVQRSTIWTNKPTGSRPLSRFVVNL